MIVYLIYMKYRDVTWDEFNNEVLNVFQKEEDARNWICEIEEKIEEAYQNHKHYVEYDDGFKTAKIDLWEWKDIYFTVNKRKLF